MENITCLSVSSSRYIKETSAKSANNSDRFIRNVVFIVKSEPQPHLHVPTYAEHDVPLEG